MKVKIVIKTKKVSTHGGTRTRNLQIRSLTPYPIRLREHLLFRIGESNPGRHGESVES